MKLLLFMCYFLHLLPDGCSVSVVGKVKPLLGCKQNKNAIKRKKGREYSDLNGGLNVALFQSGELGGILITDTNYTHMHCLI